MPFTPTDLGLGVALPSGIALVIALLCRWLPWGDAGRRQAVGWGWGVAFVVGYFLVDLGPWAPEQYRDWFPYILFGTALVGPATVAAGVSWFERAVVYSVLAAVVAWFLVPDWPTLEPAREVWLLITGVSIALCSLWFEWLAQREEGSRLPFLLTGLLIATAILVMLAGFARYAQVVLAMGGAMAGLMLAAWLSPKPARLRGMGLAYSAGTTGMLMMSLLETYSDIPRVSFGLLAFAPFSLLLVYATPLVKLEGWKSWIAPTLLIVACCVASIVLALVFDPALLKFE